MNISNFTYLENAYPQLASIGKLAEQNVESDPSTTLGKLRLLTEKLSKLVATQEKVFNLENIVHAKLIETLYFDGVFPVEIRNLLHKVRKSGNKAVHDGKGTKAEAVFMLKQTIKVLKWFYIVYKGDVDYPDYCTPVCKENNTQKLEALEKELEDAKKEALLFKEQLAKIPKVSVQEKEERKNKAQSKLKLNETEAETRERIDQQLRDADWECDTNTLNYKLHKTMPVKGRNIAIAEWRCGKLWADYALFIGTELYAIVEAKKHLKNVMSDLLQAKTYSKEVLEIEGVQFIKHHNSFVYKAPFVFATNGKPFLEQRKTASGIWFWDARKQNNIDRPLPNWFSPRDLKDKIEFDEFEGMTNLKNDSFTYLTSKDGLGLRDYQIEAIKALEHKIIHQPTERRALIAMATGTGKTRTMIGLCYRLIKAKRFKRILFLVDRTMLGDQAADNFKEVKVEGLQTFAQIYDLQDLDSKTPELDTKIHFATVQSMVKRIAYSDKVPSTGDYDCIVVDEAHRGYILDKEMDDEELLIRNQLDFQSKYRMVLDHFDAYRIGLTATPAAHTAAIFGEPVFTYSYRRAVVEGHLIDFEPPVVFKTELSENGIVWKKGDPIKVYDPEDNEIKDAGLAEDEIKVEITGFNRRVIVESFNRAILNKLITDYNLDPESRQKTLIFAATRDHADDIVRILKEEFTDLGLPVDDDAIVRLTGDVFDRENLLKKYKNEQYPSIVVTVDLLTTGIDIPSICNLIFLRRVNSRILYDQMLGRATRRCDDIGKEVFRIFDAVGVTEIMAKEDTMKPIAPSVSKTFVDLQEELQLIEDELLLQVKLDRVIAKLQRKLKSFSLAQIEQFNNLSGASNATELGLNLKSLTPTELKKTFKEQEGLWEFLDQQKAQPTPYGMLYSDAVDKVMSEHSAYDKNLKPKDYIESFVSYIKSNVNQIEALKIVCTKPASLTRKDLKSLKLALDEKGYSKTQLNAAYSELSNKKIVSDIIALVRTAALGTDLVDHKARIENAVQQLKENHSFNSVQLKWLDRIEKQLLEQNVITTQDFNRPPFDDYGGLKTINKAFKNETEQLLQELNEYLYA